MVKCMTVARTQRHQGSVLNTSLLAIQRYIMEH